MSSAALELAKLIREALGSEADKKNWTKTKGGK